MIKVALMQKSFFSPTFGTTATSVPKVEQDGGQ